MRVQDVMMGTPASCPTDTNLGAAVEILWNRNCGILPILDAEQKVSGVITDRDLCMALGTRNRLPGEITVGEVATRKVYSCQAQDDIQIALETMARNQVRRLPVLDKQGVLVGILSMDNVVLHAEAGGPGKTVELSYADVVNTLKRIYNPQLPQTVKARTATV